jgi:hypothetical protein
MRPLVLGAGGRRARRWFVLTGCLILGVLALGAVEARAATPSSLAGETLTAEPARGSTSTLTGTCNGDFEGTLNFSVSGTAAGPFPGTFTESGSFTTDRGGFLSTFSSTFTITSSSGTVTGSKRLAETNESSISCDQLDAGVVDVFADNLATTYSATINGAQRTAGTATVSIDGPIGSAPIFHENFASVGAVQLTSKPQCKDGGWRSFGFKNQGDCISFLATGGKNPPSES